MNGHNNNNNNNNNNKRVKVWTLRTTVAINPQPFAPGGWVWGVGRGLCFYAVTRVNVTFYCKKSYKKRICTNKRRNEKRYIQANRVCRRQMKSMKSHAKQGQIVGEGRMLISRTEHSVMPTKTDRQSLSHRRVTARQRITNWNRSERNRS